MTSIDDSGAFADFAVQNEGERFNGARGRWHSVRARPARRYDDRAVRYVLGGSMIASAGAIVWLCRVAHLSIDIGTWANLPYWICGVLSLIARIVSRRTGTARWQIVADIVRSYTLVTIIALMGAVASYPIAALTTGYHDARLHALDQAMHFDWLAWYRLVAAHRSLQWGGTIAYQSIFLSPALLLGYWSVHGQRRQSYRFLFVFWLAAFLTLSLFSMMPAVGPLSFLWHRPIAYLPQSEVWQYQLIPSLRAHTASAVELAHLRGLVSAPSFHAAAAILFMAKVWGIPVLRWPLIAINAILLLATPVEGTHYLSDILLGMVVAAVALGVEHRLFGDGALGPGRGVPVNRR